MGVLDRLLAPRSIAVIGGAPAERVVAQCLKFGFSGQIWPVHPTRTDMAGIECIASVDLLPSPPDAVFIGVNRHATVEVMRSLAALGAGGAVCYGSGFAESGEVGLQVDLVQAAGSVPFLGPNCYGFLNAFDRVALWPDEHGLVPIESGAGIVSQSGNVGLNLTFQQRGLRLGAMITVGNQACLGTEDAMDALLDDPRVTAIGLFIEAVKDPQRFAEVARRAHDQAIPIVALQTGRSSTGASIAASHTGAMAGRASAYDALFARNGVATVRTPTELIEALKLLDRGGPLAGHRVVSLSCSGGEASLVADRAEGTNLVFDHFDDDHRARIEATLGDELVTVSNPFDYHTFMWGDRDAMGRCFTTVMEGDQDVTMLVLDAPTASGNDPSSWLPAIDALGDAATATGGRAVVVATMPECLDLRFRDHITGRGLTPLLGLTEALAALDAAGFAGTPPGPMHAPVTAPPNTRVVDEGAAKARLRYLGLPVPDGRMVLRDGVAAAAAEVGYPITVKGLGIAHKSEVGAVKVGIPDEPALLAAIASMSDDMVRFLVESTVTDVVAEVLVAVRRDPPVGWLVTLGFGGVNTEVWHDVTHLLAPVTANDVIAALARLRSAPLLTGFRGRPPADIGALADLVVTIVDTVVGTAAVEVELNPVLVGRHGATIVDALWVEEIPA
ncbi:MAG: acetate--CoA ligase family protein [Ilumatobacteraceae bacterium]